jgi:hypothetical protein
MTECASLGRLEALVNDRVWGQVEDLRVEAQDAGVVLRGRCRTYYAKQLAQEAVLRSSPFPLLVNQIEVLGRSP